MSALPVPKEILTQHVAVLGKTRSGKSSVMRMLVESLLARELPVCIVDPKGDWWGLKLAADGKHPGFPIVVFGGEHADIPINEHAGAHVAELFATGNRPCLIDFGGWMVAARTRFWIDFASTLFKHTKGQRWLVVDEVHNFCPKGTLKDREAGSMATALHWTNRLASEGLGKGLAMLFASQRPQKVHNDTLTSAETLIAMRVLHPSDRGAVSDWIKGCGTAGGDEVLNSLGQMERGEGWVWSPEIGFGPQRVKFPMFSTYDSFRPQTVEDTKKLKGWAEVNLDDVRSKMATFIETAKADDPKLLRAELARVRQELAKAQQVKPQPVQASKTLTAKPLLTDADRALLAGIDSKLGSLEHALSVDEAILSGERLTNILRDAVAKVVAELHDAVDRRRAEFVKMLDGKRLHLLSAKTYAASQPLPAIRDTTQVRPGQSRPLPAAQPGRTSVATRPAGDGPQDARIERAAERKVLTVLAQYPDGRSIRQVAILAGYATNGGGFRNAVGRMRSLGFITNGVGNNIAITDEGLNALGRFDPLPTGNALREHWLRQLDRKAEREVLAVMCAVYPQRLTPAEIAVRTETQYEPNGGGFRNALGKLRTLELIEGHGDFSASEELFG